MSLDLESHKHVANKLQMDISSGIPSLPCEIKLLILKNLFYDKEEDDSPSFYARIYITNYESLKACSLACIEFAQIVRMRIWESVRFSLRPNSSLEYFIDRILPSICLNIRKIHFRVNPLDNEHQHGAELCFVPPEDDVTSVSRYTGTFQDRNERLLADWSEEGRGTHLVTVLEKCKKLSQLDLDLIYNPDKYSNYPYQRTQYRLASLLMSYGPQLNALSLNAPTPYYLSPLYLSQLLQECKSLRMLSFERVEKDQDRHLIKALQQLKNLKYLFLLDVKLVIRSVEEPWHSSLHSLELQQSSMNICFEDWHPLLHQIGRSLRTLEFYSQNEIFTSEFSKSPPSVPFPKLQSLEITTGHSALSRFMDSPELLEAYIKYSTDDFGVNSIIDFMEAHKKLVSVVLKGLAGHIGVITAQVEFEVREYLRTRGPTYPVLDLKIFPYHEEEE